MLTTTFPRWSDDSTASFILDLSKNVSMRGVQVTVLAPHHPGAMFREECEGLQIYRFPYFWPYRYERLCYGGGILANLKRSIIADIQAPLLLLSETYHALRLTRKERVDVIHAHWIMPSGLVALFCRVLCKTPVVVSCHGSDVEVLCKNGVGRFLSGRVLGKADRITTVSAYLKTKVTGVGIPSDRVDVLHDGVDTSSFRFSPKMTGSHKLVYVGRLADEKGLENLLKSMALLKKKFPDVTLTIVGEGPLRKKLEDLSNELNMRESISFEGAVPHSRISEYMRDADALVLPSISEGLSVVILEAMACGTPVIASNVGGVGDIVSDGFNGFVVEPGDVAGFARKIMELWSDKSLIERFSQNGLDTVKQRFSWKVIAEKFIKVYGDAEKDGR